MTTTLGGLSVLDLTLGPVGGLMTMILSDFGAEVIKIEPPGGDPFRGIPSSPMWLRGKKSIELDIDAVADVRKIHRLIAETDVVVTGQRSVEASDLGCDYDTLSRINPRLIYCQITGFGDEGPYAHLPPYEAVVTAKGGRMRDLTGIPRRPGPVFTAVEAATHATTQNALSGILAALVERRKSGSGQMLRTSLLQGLMPFEQHASIQIQVAAKLAEQKPKPQNRAKTKVKSKPNPRRDPYPWIANFDYHPVQAGDGRWLQMGNLMERSYRRFLELTGLDRDLERPPFNRPRHEWSPDTREAFRNILMLRMQEKTSDEWMRMFLDDGNVAAHPYMTSVEALDDPDIVENGHVMELAGIRQLGPLARLTKTPAEILTPAPEPGRDNGLLESIGPPETTGPSHLPTSTEPPLAGVTVLEFAAIIATPFGTSLLGDMGARVIKVEPIGGDPFRSQSNEREATRVNCNKESIIVDLKTDQGKAIAHRLIRDADMLVHNYRPGVPERLGISYGEASRLNPDIVYLQANGYGTQGPGVLRPSAAPIPGAALGGVLRQLGSLEDRRLQSVEELRETARKLSRANDVVPDPATSMVVCSAALLGLCAKQRTGKGQQIYIDMFGANAYANYDGFIDYEGKPERPSLGSDLFGPHPLYRLYPCKEGWVFLGLLLDKEWEKFCRTAGRSDLLQNPAFSTDGLRKSNEEQLSSQLGNLLKTRTAADWESLVGSQGLGCVVADGPSTGEFLLRDPHVQQNHWMVPAHHGVWGDYLRHGPMVGFSRSKCELTGSVLAGEHTGAVLKELGYSESEISSLMEEGVVSGKTISWPKGWPGAPESAH